VGVSGTKKEKEAGGDGEMLGSKRPCTPGPGKNGGEKADGLTLGNGGGWGGNSKKKSGKSKDRVKTDLIKFGNLGLGVPKRSKREKQLKKIHRAGKKKE